MTHPLAAIATGVAAVLGVLAILLVLAIGALSRECGGE